MIRFIIIDLVIREIECLITGLSGDRNRVCNVQEAGWYIDAMFKYFNSCRRFLYSFRESLFTWRNCWNYG